jgi:curved DNA-binding protein CbpA
LPNYYQILQLPINSGIDDIKKAYRRLAREYHPDVSKLNDAREKFIEITEAYEYLVNRIKFEEDQKKAKSEEFNNEAQSVIDAWIIQERERIRARARKYAGMKYNQFRGTKEYRTTRVISNFFNVGILFIGICIILGAVFGTYQRWKESPNQVNASYIASAVIIASMGLLISTYSIYMLWKAFLMYIKQKSNKK